MSMALFTFIPMEAKCWCWRSMWTMKTGGMPKLLTWRLFYIRQSWQIQNQYSSTSWAKYFHQGKEIRMLVENYRVFWDTNLNVTTFLWLQQGHWVNASPSVFPIIEILLLFLFHNLVEAGLMFSSYFPRTLYRELWVNRWYKLSHRKRLLPSVYDKVFKMLEKVLRWQRWEIEIWSSQVSVDFLNFTNTKVCSEEFTVSAEIPVFTNWMG